MSHLIRFVLFLILSSSFLNADFEEGKRIFKEKCSSCHGGYIKGSIIKKNFFEKDNKILNLTAPTVNMLAYALKDSPLHIGEKSDAEMQRFEIEEFLKDYLYNPNRENSICDPNILKYYMDKKSMKGQISDDEITHITDYLFNYKEMRKKKYKEPKKILRDFKNAEDVLKAAKENNYAILIEAVSNSCYFCKKMDEEVLSKKEIKELLRDNFIFLKVDIDANKLPFNLDKEFKGITPTFFALTPEGKFRGVYHGAWSIGDFREILKENITK